MDEDEKRCGSCGLVQPLTSFNLRRRATDGRQARCRDCSRAWYVANRTSHKANTRRIAAQSAALYRQRLAEYFASHPCVDCGETDVRCLEFDHRDDERKLADISTMLRDRVPWKRIEQEIAKCDVRCANCHRCRTALRSGSWRVAVHAQQVAQTAAAAQERLHRLFA